MCSCPLLSIRFSVEELANRTSLYSVTVSVTSSHLKSDCKRCLLDACLCLSEWWCRGQVYYQHLLLVLYCCELIVDFPLRNKKLKLR